MTVLELLTEIAQLRPGNIPALADGEEPEISVVHTEAGDYLNIGRKPT